MAYLIIGLALFFTTHLYSAFRSRTPEHDIKQKIGHLPYMGLYSLVSLVGFGLIIYGFGAARPAAMAYEPPAWGHFAALALMLPAMVFLTAAYMPAGHIKQTLKHPMIIGVGLWAIAHLLANGDQASVLLCSSFLAYAVVSRLALMRRTSPANTKPPVWIGDLASLLLGLGAYLAMVLVLHTKLFGVDLIG